MRSDERTDRTPTDSTTDDEVYEYNEAGEPRLAGRSESEGLYEGYPDDGFEVIDPKTYGLLLLVGVVLLLFPEPLTSTLGLILIAVGVFVGLVDLLSPD